MQEIEEKDEERLSQPVTHTSVKGLRGAYEEFQQNKDIDALMNSIQMMESRNHELDPLSEEHRIPLNREGLHLVCFDFVWS